MDERPAEIPPEVVAARLCAMAGLRPPVRLERLSGGRNNRVWRVDAGEAEAAVVLKVYFRDPRDTRDRLHAEWSFLQHAWGCGVRSVPRPLAADPDVPAGLYSFLPGRRPRPDEIGVAAVDAAIGFMAAVNIGARPASAMPWASEACVSLKEHLATVDRRIGRLRAIERNGPLAEEAIQLVEDELVPAWQRVRGKALSTASAQGIEPDRPLTAAQMCASPSDFGFHNALRDAAGAFAFLDFEYAGRDDPAKLVCDFFCQPDIPVPEAFYPRLLERMQRVFGDDPEFATRCNLLRSVYQMKWACIVLNEFLPMDINRRRFSGNENVNTGKLAEQIGKARAFVSLL